MIPIGLLLRENMPKENVILTVAGIERVRDRSRDKDSGRGRKKTDLQKFLDEAIRLKIKEA